MHYICNYKNSNMSKKTKNKYFQVRLSEDEDKEIRKASVKYNKSITEIYVKGGLLFCEQLKKEKNEKIQI